MKESMTPITLKILHFGYYITFDSHAPENVTVDEVGCFGKDRFKTLEAAKKDAREYVGDYKDIILFYGMDSKDVMQVIAPMGFLTGEDFLQGV